MGQRDELVEVAQTGLVLGQNNQVVGTPAASPAPLHGSGEGVDLAEVGRSQLLQPGDQSGQDVATHLGIVAGPVMVEGWQLQEIGHRIQLVVVQLGAQVLG